MLRWLRNSIADSSVTVVVTNPPMGQLSGSEWAMELKRVMRKDANGWLHCGADHVLEFLTALEDAGLHTVNHIIVCGASSKRRLDPKDLPTTHTHLLYFAKDPSSRKFYQRKRSPKSRYEDMQDVWWFEDFSVEGASGHPNIPAPVLQKILQFSMPPRPAADCLVLDPFIERNSLLKPLVAPNLLRYCASRV